MSWKGVDADGQNGAAEGPQNIIVIPKGSPIPSLKAVTIIRQGTFAVDLQYADVSELQAPAKISSYTVSNPYGQVMYPTLPCIHNCYCIMQAAICYLGSAAVFNMVVFLMFWNGQIGPFQSSKGDRAKLKVRVRLNLHGMVSIESATVSLLLLN